MDRNKPSKKTKAQDRYSCPNSAACLKKNSHWSPREKTNSFYLRWLLYSRITCCSFQVIGSRGVVEVNPRDAMAREASIHGVMLFNSNQVKENRLFFSFVISHLIALSRCTTLTLENKRIRRPLGVKKTIATVKYRTLLLYCFAF